MYRYKDYELRNFNRTAAREKWKNEVKGLAFDLDEKTVFIE
jgi:hypothetical protein